MRPAEKESSCAIPQRTTSAGSSAKGGIEVTWETAEGRSPYVDRVSATRPGYRLFGNELIDQVEAGLLKLDERALGGGLVIEDDMPEIGWRFYEHDALGVHVVVLERVDVEVSLFSLLD